MIATNRRMPARDFLLVVLSVAVIVLSKWPETQPRQWVQLRQPDGMLRQYSLSENDPTLPKLRLSLQRWARAGQETRLAIANWRAELADFYAERTRSASPSAGPIRPVAFSQNTGQLGTNGAGTASGVAQEAREIASQHDYWLSQGRRARAEIEKVEEVRRSRRALEVPPPIVFGRREDGRKPVGSVVIAAASGVVVALAFAAWTLFCPAVLLSRQCEKADRARLDSNEDPQELQLRVPSNWIRVRQPVGVLARWGATAVLVLGAVISLWI
jgi:hypothetical protein